MRVYSFLIALLITAASQAQSDVPTMEKGHFVVVGVFAKKENAIRYQSEVAAKGISVQCSHYPANNFYYVHLTGSKELAESKAAVIKIRENPEFSAAWIKHAGTEGEQTVAQDIPQDAPETLPAQAPAPTVEEPTEPEADDSAAITVFTPEQVTLANTEVFLSLYNEANDRVVEGKVQVIDTERGRLISELAGNNYLVLPDPKSKSGKITLLCDAFGYRKVQHDLIFSKPLNDSTLHFIDEMGTSLVVKFGLTRYQTGDIRAMYNVYFYNDAAVFLPESKYELNELLLMMRENPAYRIRLHGHSNGNYHGKIIKVGADKNFFGINDKSIKTSGSAKELSESRAEVIKDYLVANGIEASRMEVKAWGGKRPLYDKKSVNAKKNIRVEVEVINQ